MTSTRKAQNLAPIGWRPRVTFADRLRMVRRHYGVATGEQVGQREMAHRIGWGDKAYCSYESGYHVPSEMWRFCLAVSGLTGVDPTWLAGDEMPPLEPTSGTADLGSRQFGCITSTALAA